MPRRSTRMCAARESDSRRPSRTTSWSSTISQVISSGIAGECMPRVGFHTPSDSWTGSGGGASGVFRRSRTP